MMRSGLPIELAEATSQGGNALFSLLSERLQKDAGLLLVTVLVPDEDGMRLNRLHSTDEENYPLGAADEVVDTAWFRQLFRSGKPVVANDDDEIASWLPGYTEYAAQGYGSLANLPINVAGRVIGIVNVMGTAGHFTPARLGLISSWLPLAALAILAERTQPAAVISS